MEQWKDIEGYEGLYQVSNYGRVLSLPRNTTKGGLIKLTPDKDGYLCASLYKKNHRKTAKVHRIVAMAFLDKVQGKNLINHKDENKTNNHVENLEWCDIQYNNTYNMRQKKINARKRKPVCAICKNGNIMYFDSISSASRILKTSKRNIEYCLDGVQKTAAGMQWERMQAK